MFNPCPTMRSMFTQNTYAAHSLFLLLNRLSMVHPCAKHGPMSNATNDVHPLCSCFILIVLTSQSFVPGSSMRNTGDHVQRYERYALDCAYFTIACAWFLHAQHRGPCPTIRSTCTCNDHVAYGLFLLRSRLCMVHPCATHASMSCPTIGMLCTHSTDVAYGLQVLGIYLQERKLAAQETDMTGFGPGK